MIQLRSPRMWALTLLGSVPLLLKIPYITGAWQSSTMDSHDWIFPIIAVCMSLIVIVTAETAWPEHSKKGMCLAGLFLLAFIGFQVLSINAFAIMTAIGFWWSVMWILMGWRHAFTLIPSFGTLLLATTSSTYWICFFLGVTPEQAVGLKIGFAVVFAVLTVLMICFRWCFCELNTLYCLAMLCSLGILFQIKSVMRTYPPVLVTCEMELGKDVIGRELEANESFRRFFKTSNAHHFEYASDTHSYTLLAVQCGEDVHEIHPASHCLRSGGWNIMREEGYEATIRGRSLGVTEVEAEKDGYSMLVWVWYSNPYQSTGNFLGFRRMWSNKDEWETYQLAVNHQDDLESSRKALTDFLEKIPWKERQSDDMMKAVKDN